MFEIGGFLAGLVVPHDNGYAISIVEKLEDLVTIVFLPLVRPCVSKEK
jgi:Kef-type K+ transport system membrane component KefB